MSQSFHEKKWAKLFQLYRYKTTTTTKEDITRSQSSEQNESMNSNDFVSENHDSMIYILIINHKRRDLGLRITVVGTRPPLSPLYKRTGAYPDNYEHGEG